MFPFLHLKFHNEHFHLTLLIKNIILITVCFSIYGNIAFSLSFQKCLCVCERGGERERELDKGTCCLPVSVDFLFHSCTI